MKVITGIYWLSVLIFLGIIGHIVVRYSGSSPHTTPIFVPTKYDADSESLTTRSMQPEDKIISSVEREAPGEENDILTDARNAAEKDDIEKAIQIIREALGKTPNDPSLHNDLGVYLTQTVNDDEAESSYRKALSLDPAYARAHYNLGTLMFKRGLLGEAETHLRAAIQHRPYYTEAHYNLAQVFTRLGKTQEAIERYQLITRINRTARYAKAYYNLGMIFLEQRRLQEALDSFHEAVRLEPTYSRARFNLAVVLSKLGLLEQARRQYEKLLVLEPNYVSALINVGIIYLKEEQYDNALDVLNHASKIAPENRKIWYFTGRCYMEKEDYTQAVQFLSKAIEVEPNYPEAYYRLGKISLGLHETTKAADYFGRAVKLSSENSTYRLNLARTQKTLGKLEESAESYRSVLRLDRGNIDARYELGRIYLGLDKLNNATIQLKKVLEIQPDNYLARFYLGLTFHKRELWPQAESDFKQALKLEETVPAFYNHGLVLVQLKRPEEAIQAFIKALEIDPRHVGSLAQLGKLYATRGSEAEALTILSRLQRMKHDDPTVYNIALNQYNDEKYNKAESYFKLVAETEGRLKLKSLNMLGLSQSKQKKYAQAIKSFREALTIDPKYSSARKNLAVAHAHAGDRENAISELKTTLTQSPDDKVALFNLGLQYEAIDSKPNAEQLYARLLKLKPGHYMANLKMARLMEEKKDWTAARQYYMGADKANPGQKGVLEALERIRLQAVDSLNGL